MISCGRILFANWILGSIQILNKHFVQLLAAAQFFAATQINHREDDGGDIGQQPPQNQCNKESFNRRYCHVQRIYKANEKRNDWQ